MLPESPIMGIMRNIREYSDKTSPYELFTHLYGLIINRKIILVSQLETYMARVPEGPAKEFAFTNAFRILKEMHWGFFSGLDAGDYPVLWKQLTVPHPRYPAVGELKRSISITDIYTAFIDIHGYTEFCRTHGRNSSMLQLLDNCIENDIRRLCRENHVMGNRARGDEIILVGTSAYDVMNTVIMIADYFGDRKLIKDNDLIQKRSGQAMQLPPLSISAGVAGGKKYAVMVITAAGDLSGSVVNTAARLQGRANKIANDRSHILSTNQVIFSYQKAMKSQPRPRFSEKEAAFLDLGPVEFKGVELRLAEVIIEQDQMYRTGYQDALDKLFDALRCRSWSDRVFASLSNLIIAATKAIPPFEIDLPEAREGLLSVSNRTVYMMVNKVNGLFRQQKKYAAALEYLGEMAEILAQIENFDHAVLLYLRTVIDGYDTILEAYKKQVGAYSEKNKESLFSTEELKKFDNAKTSSMVYDMMKDEMTDRIQPEKRKALWARLAGDLGQEIESVPYLAK